MSDTPSASQPPVTLPDYYEVVTFEELVPLPTVVGSEELMVHQNGVTLKANKSHLTEMVKNEVITENINLSVWQTTEW